MKIGPRSFAKSWISIRVGSAWSAVHGENEAEQIGGISDEANFIADAQIKADAQLKEQSESGDGSESSQSEMVRGSTTSDDSGVGEFSENEEQNPQMNEINKDEIKYQLKSFLETKKSQGSATQSSTETTREDVNRIVKEVCKLKMPDNVPKEVREMLTNVSENETVDKETLKQAMEVWKQVIPAGNLNCILVAETKQVNIRRLHLWGIPNIRRE